MKAAAARRAPPDELRSPSLEELLLEVTRVAALARSIGTGLPGCDASSDVARRSSALLEELVAARESLARVQATLDASSEQQVARNRRRIAARYSAPFRVNLGAGDRGLPGWVNLDVNSQDLGHCLQWRLPFADGSVKYVFFAHALEHLYYKDEALFVLREVRRVLAPGGVVRIVVPDIQKFFEAYAARNRRFFEFRKRIWPGERAHTTPLEQTLAYCGASLPSHGFFWHKWGYDHTTLRRLLREARFSSVKRSAYMKSRHAELRVDDVSGAGSVHDRGEAYSLFVEASP